ncbi:MAG: hypothetical protein MJK04_23285, partial [Psychrosphaera sp.]|nr:hypothetical protein [Psychrosphaera sp.]
MASAQIIQSQVGKVAHLSSFTAHSKANSKPVEQEAYPGELAELREKASRLGHLVDTLPAGVITLDSCGCIGDTNQVAIDMLGDPLEGERWIDIINRAFSPKS